MMLQCFKCGQEFFDEDLILANGSHLCFDCGNSLRNLELNKCYNMDCEQGLKLIKTESVDLILTDPPYGISFMGKDWDNAVPSLEIWRQCYRILKHGAFAFVMCIPRMDCQSEMVKRLKLVGFDIGFTPIYWAYSSGFPKAMNVSKKADSFLGHDREQIKPTGSMHKDKNVFGDYSGLQDCDVPISEQAKQLDGSYAGFQPKPAVEIIIVAMKPLNQENYVEQALFNRKGVTWLDDCRIPFENENDIESSKTIGLSFENKSFDTGVYQMNINHSFVRQSYDASKGRFPANLLVSDGILDDGKITRTKAHEGDLQPLDTQNQGWGFRRLPFCEEDSGSFSRYFSLDSWWQERIRKLPDEVKKVFPFLIAPKASSSERQEGLEQFQEKLVPNSLSGGSTIRLDGRSVALSRNIHPTVKPLKLMSYLITLGSRENDLVLDPFIGSGTTAIACRLLNRNFIGFEIDKDYFEIANARLKDCLQQKKLTET